MSEKRLRELLHALHEELVQAERVDPAAEAELRGVMSDIHGVLDRAQPEAHEGLRQRLRKSLDHFEDDHPRLALTVRRVLDVMSRL